MDDDSTMDEKNRGTGFSFGFSKKHEQKQLGKSAVAESTIKEDDEPDYVLSVDGKNIKSTKEPKPKKQEYVIPLIKQNNWRGDSVAGESRKEITSTINDERGENLDELAAKEILIETRRYNEDWDERGQTNSTVSIPLLMQNKVPEGFESDDHLDVSLRPEIPDDADYEQIPIEHFGMAMLRGMGWSKDRGVGKNGKSIAPIEALLRPKGLGLGADRKNSGPDKKETTNNVDTKEELELKKNSYCVVLEGINKGLYGTVEGIDEDNARIMLKLTLSSKVVNIMQCNVKVVDKKEYEKYSKYLNKQKADSFKETEEQKMKNENHTENGDQRKKKKKSHKRELLSDNEERKGSASHKSKRSRQNHEKEDSTSQDRSPKTKTGNSHTKDAKNSKSHSKNVDVSESEEEPETRPLWLRNDLRVRIVDKSFSKGKYYKEKVVIVDVPSPGVCVCRTDNNKVIPDVHQSSLETVIPRDDDAYVTIVSGSEIGQIGKIMKRDKDRCLAIVQLLSDRDVVLRLQFDEVCEYVGNVHDHEDF